MKHVVQLKSESATFVRSLRGATAYKAKSNFEQEDDHHITEVNRGDTFYLKKRGIRFYFIFVEDKDRFLYVIDEKRFNELASKHKPVNSKVKKPVRKRRPTRTDLPPRVVDHVPIPKGTMPTDAELRAIQRELGSTIPLSDPYERIGLLGEHISRQITDMNIQREIVRDKTLEKRKLKSRWTELTNSRTGKPRQISRVEKAIIDKKAEIESIRGRVEQYRSNIKAAEKALRKLIAKPKGMLESTSSLAKQLATIACKPDKSARDSARMFELKLKLRIEEGE